MTAGGGQRPTEAGPRIFSAALTLAIDRTSREIIGALDARGIPSLLIKGPVLADWLYGQSEHRPYGDTDLIVPVSHRAGAHRVLGELGFVAVVPDAERSPDVPTTHAWTRDGLWVDLDVSFDGVGVDPDAFWRALSAERELWSVGSGRLWTPGPRARCLLLALHAAKHGVGHERSLRDLRKGTELQPAALWRQAAQLARELEADESFSAGLRLVPAGERLADELGLSTTFSIGVRMRGQTAPPLAHGLERLARTRGLKAKIGLVAHEVVPTGDFLRWWSAVARRGPLGLTVVRLWRPIWMLKELPSALLAWGTAERATATRRQRRTLARSWQGALSRRNRRRKPFSGALFGANAMSRKLRRGPTAPHERRAR